MANLTGKVAIVTGASRGIGRAIAARLAKEGAKTVLCARDVIALEAVVREIEGGGGTAASMASPLSSSARRWTHSLPDPKDDSCKAR